MKKIGVCRLCGATAELQQSHILPAAAHTHTKVNGLNVLIGNRKKIFRPKNQSDFKEYLLCFDCEQMLSTFENRAIRFCRDAWTHREAVSYEISQDFVQALIAFAYSVFWRSSVSKSIEGYSVNPDIESELRDAFYGGRFPDLPRLAVSVSFLKVLDITMTGRMLMTPLVAAYAAGAKIHYFVIMGIVFRMSVPNALYEINENEFLRFHERTGRVYHLQTWEQKVFDSELTLSAVIAKSEGAHPL